MTQDNTPQFPHREPFPLTDGSTRELALEFVDELLRLEQETHPWNRMVDGVVTNAAVGKDENSRLALMVVEDLVRLLAGWAIDHQIGLVLNGLPGGATAPQDGSYTNTQIQADDHIHEATAPGYDFADSQINRRVLAALLQHGPGPFPTSLVIEATDALIALDMGETQPFVVPMRGVGKEGQAYTKWKLRYWAVLHVEYFRGMNLPRPDALGKVADAYGKETETIESWIRDIPTKLKGITPVLEMKPYARQCGKTAYNLKVQDSLSDKDQHLLEILSRNYGEIGLTRHGEEFRQVPQTKGSVVPFPP